MPSILSFYIHVSQYVKQISGGPWKIFSGMWEDFKAVYEYALNNTRNKSYFKSSNPFTNQGKHLHLQMIYGEHFRDIC